MAPPWPDAEFVVRLLTIWRQRSGPQGGRGGQRHRAAGHGHFSGPGSARSASAAKLCLMVAHEDGADDDQDQHDDADDDDHRAGQVFDLAPQHVGGKAEDSCPDERSGGAGEQKLPPRHAVRSGQNAGDAAQHRDEAGNEDDLAAVAQEQVFAELDSAFGDPHIGAVAQQQPIAEFAADHVADHLPDQSRSRCRQHDVDDVEMGMTWCRHRSRPRSARSPRAWEARGSPAG